MFITSNSVIAVKIENKAVARKLSRNLDVFFFFTGDKHKQEIHKYRRQINQKFLKIIFAASEYLISFELQNCTG